MKTKRNRACGKDVRTWTAAVAQEDDNGRFVFGKFKFVVFGGGIAYFGYRRDLLGRWGFEGLEFLEEGFFEGGGCHCFALLGARSERLLVAVAVVVVVMVMAVVGVDGVWWCNRTNGKRL